MAGGPQAGGQTVVPNINAAAAQGIYGAGLGTAANMGYQPGQIGTLAQTDIGQYQNPFTQQVIEANEADILRGAQIGMNQLGAQAQAARAFGGSRQGVAEAELGRNVLQQLAQSSANLRQQGFNTAQQMAQQDIQNRLSQENLGLSGAQQRLGAAGQLANISQTGFGMGQQALQGLSSVGAQQQAMQQALIDAARGQFAGYTGAPAQSIGYVSSALGATPVPQTQTTTKQPGLFDYLTMGASMIPITPSDVRLKKDIKLIDKLSNGIEVFTWGWNDEAQKIGANKYPTRGVIAQKVMKVIPEAVMMGNDGFYRVDYNHPELRGAL